MTNDPNPITARSFLARSIASDQEAFATDARRVAEQAAYISANPPTGDRAASGDIANIAQYVTDLLRRASKIEASLEALCLMGVETVTPEK